VAINLLNGVSPNSHPFVALIEEVHLISASYELCRFSQLLRRQTISMVKHGFSLVRGSLLFSYVLKLVKRLILLRVKRLVLLLVKRRLLL